MANKEIVNKKTICDVVMKLFLYADMCKMIHYTTDKIHCHKLCDEVRDSITKFADDLAEQVFGQIGKPQYNDFSTKQNISLTRDIVDICKKCFVIANDLKKTPMTDSTVSLIDDFCGEMSQKAYLGSFDDISNEKINECVNNVIKKYL